MKRASWLLVLVAAIGCAPATGPFAWYPPPGDTRALADKYPHAVAVLLSRDERVALTFDRSAAASQLLRHDVIAILSEGGDHWAEVAIPLGTSRLQFLRARTISPDGHIEEVKPEEVHTAEVRKGSRIDAVEAAVKVFRMPGARVGSIVDYFYGIENDGGTFYLSSAMSASIPVEHYHLEVSMTGPADLALQLYNAHATTNKEEHLYSQRLIIDQRDIPAAKQELLAPPRTVTEPWWAVTVTRISPLRGISLGLFDTWSHALMGLGHALYGKTKDYADAALKPDLGGCDGRGLCAVERALALVTDKTELSRFVHNLTVARPCKDVLASRLATNVEKALLLRGALQAAGIKSSLVALARDLGNDFDPKFPSPGRADHLIVHVDAQPGLDAALYIDPSCESCAVGQLPAWAINRQAIIFGQPRVTPSSLQPETPIRIVRILSDVQEVNLHRETVEATIEPSGKIAGGLTVELRGAQAVDFRILSRGFLDDAWRKAFELILHERAKTAQLGELSGLGWDKREARAVLHAGYSIAGYGAVDGGRVIVPLKLLHLDVDRELGDEPRRHDVMVRTASREEETIVFHLPSGWVATELPRSATWHSEALDAAFEVTSAPGTVTVRRIAQTHVGHWGPGEYDDVAEVARQVSAVRQAAFAIAPAG